ncbi:MAG: NADP oxidoreductase [Planctomycetota bacterium]
MTKKRVATLWLDGCSGCHMSFLDLDEGLLEVARRIELVYGPLVDRQELPDGVDLAIVEGAVSSVEDLEKIRAVRARSKIVVALGDCAVTGNVPSMRNPISQKRLLDRVYLEGIDPGSAVPTEGVPPLLRYAVPVHRVVPVDVYVPGCPPRADAIRSVLSELLEGRIPDLSGVAKFG